MHAKGYPSRRAASGIAGLRAMAFDLSGKSDGGKRIWTWQRPEAGATVAVDGTFQRGKAPQVQVEVEGLDATVTVGDRAVRFDGSRIVFVE